MTLTLTLTDQLSIEESLARSGNNIKMAINDVIAISVSLDSAYKIKRAGDTAFMRTNYP